jgi:hypothetical protein
MQAQVLVQFNHCPLIVHHCDPHLLHLHFLVYYRKGEEGEEEKLGEPNGPISAAKQLGANIRFCISIFRILSPEN